MEVSDDGLVILENGVPGGGEPYRRLIEPEIPGFVTPVEFALQDKATDFSHNILFFHGRSSSSSSDSTYRHHNPLRLHPHGATGARLPRPVDIPQVIGPSPF